MSEPIRDLETAVRELGALPMPAGNEPEMQSEQRAAIAELIGDAKPATGHLVEQLAKSVRDRREHEHPTWEDLYCLNLVSWMGERMGPVLRRLLDAEDRIERRRARLVALQNDALDMRGSLSPNGEDRKVPFPLGETLTPAVDWLIARVAELEARLAEFERPADEDPIAYALTDQTGVFRVVADLTNVGTRDDALYAAERVEYGLEANGYGCAVSVEAADAPLTVFRASHDSIPMRLYTTAAEARRHCETELRREWPNSLLDWIEDEEDGVAELVAENADGETETGYVVTAVEVTAEYDAEADA